MGRMRPVLGRMKRSRDDTWCDDNDDDDDGVVPEPKLDTFKGRLHFLQEADETFAGGDNFPGVWISGLFQSLALSLAAVVCMGHIA